MPQPRLTSRTKDSYLNGNGLVVLETTKAILRFQGIAIGILGRVERGRWQVSAVFISAERQVK